MRYVKCVEVVVWEERHVEILFVFMLVCLADVVMNKRDDGRL